MLTAVHVVSVCRVCVRLPQSPISAEDTYRRDWEAYVEVCLERRRAIAMVPGLPQLPMAERHRLGHKSKEGVLTPTTRCALLCLRLTCPVAATCLVPHRADELPCPVRSLLPRVDARSVVPVWCAPALSAVCLCSLLTSFVLCLLRSAVRGIAAMTTTVHFVRFCGPVRSQDKRQWCRSSGTNGGTHQATRRGSHGKERGRCLSGSNCGGGCRSPLGFCRSRRVCPVRLLLKFAVETEPGIRFAFDTYSQETPRSQSDRTCMVVIARLQSHMPNGIGTLTLIPHRLPSPPGWVLCLRLKAPGWKYRVLHRPMLPQPPVVPGPPFPECHRGH